MERTKAFRRSCDRKAKLKAKKSMIGEGMDERGIGKMANCHCKPCSCEMCGNPRHDHYSSEKNKMTMQERKAEEDFKDWENEEE